MHVLICIGVWICIATIITRPELLPANHLLIMDQSTPELFNSRDFLLSMNVRNQHYLLPKDVLTPFAPWAFPNLNQQEEERKEEKSTGKNKQNY